MSVELLSNQMRDYADTLIASADDPHALSQLRRVEIQEPVLSSALVKNWSNRIYPAIPESVRLVSTLACITSLVTSASQIPHAHYVADKVHDNLRTLSQALLSTRCIERGELLDYWRRHDDAPLGVQGRIVGQLSEASLLAAIWSGIAGGYRPEDTFALPTLRREDKGEVKDGFLTGVDIKIQRSSNDETLLIQSKTSSKRHGHAMDNPYYPGIAVIPVTQLRDRRGRRLNGPRDLLGFVAADSVTDLEAINTQIDIRLERARVRLARHHARQAENPTQLPWQQSLQQIGNELAQLEQNATQD